MYFPDVVGKTVAGNTVAGMARQNAARLARRATRRRAAPAPNCDWFRSRSAGIRRPLMPDDCPLIPGQYAPQ